MYELTITTGWNQLIRFTDARLVHLRKLAGEFSTCKRWEIKRGDKSIIEHINVRKEA